MSKVSSEALQNTDQLQLFAMMESGDFREKLFELLFGFADFHTHPAFSAASSEVICGTTWGKGGIAFQCMDCEKDNNCVICAACFFDSKKKHENHRVKLIRTTGGCCDCGDISSWSQDGFCSKHGPNRVPSETLDSLVDERELQVYAAVLFLHIVELISRSMTVNVNAACACNGMDFLLECATLQVFEPVVLEALDDADMALWIQVSCILGGRTPRPRPPVMSVPSLEDSAAIASSISQFFLSLVQRNAKFKIEFTRLFVLHYGEILSVRAYESDEDSESNTDLSALSVQLFTIPEVCEALLTESRSNIISVLLENLFALLGSVRDANSGRWTARQVPSIVEPVLWRVIHDLGYCLHHQKVCEHLLENKKFCELVVACMRPLQHANVQSIKHGDHVVYENVMWRSLFMYEQLLMQAMSPLILFSRKNEKKSILFIQTIVENLEPFDLLKFAGENASFHFPLIRMLVESVDINALGSASDSELVAIRSILTPDVLKQLLLECIRPLLLLREISTDAWVRNGNAMRNQAAMFESSENVALSGIALALILISRSPDQSAITEFFRALILLICDIPDDSADDSTLLRDRILHISNEQTFGAKNIDEWLQLFFRDCTIGGRGNAADMARRKACLTCMLDLVCRLTTDSSFVSVVQLSANEEIKKSLIKRCLVQRLCGQRLSYSQLFGLLPSKLRRPEQLVETVISEITNKEGTSGNYALNAEGLRLVDVCHRTFSADAHALEELVSKQERVVSLKSTGEPDIVRDAIVGAMSGSNGVLFRAISSLLRMRLCEKKIPNCLEASGYPPAELPPTALDQILIFAYRTLENVRSTRGLMIFSESESCWTQPMFGLTTTLQGLVQRQDLNGLAGIYVGKEDGRFCVTMHHHGKLLVKESNAIFASEKFGIEKKYISSIPDLLGEISCLAGNEISELCLKAAKDLVERFAESTGVSSLRGTPQPSGVTGQDLKAKNARMRQALLMKKMLDKQTRFTGNVDTEEVEERGTTGTECAMCRDSSLRDNDIFVAMGFCAAGNSIASSRPRGSCVAFPASPYMNACLHTVHRSCWQSHLEAAGQRPMGGPAFLTLNRHLDGEIQCPVCRSLSNLVIPLAENQNQISEEEYQAIVDFGERLLEMTRKSSGNIESGSLWLSRDVPCWRPFMFNPGVDALAEATYNELILSAGLTPSKILSPNALHSMLVRCLQAVGTRRPRDQEWRVWTKDAHEAARVDCARLFLESGEFGDKEFMKDVMALKFVQLELSGKDSGKELGNLGTIMAFIVSSVDSFSASDLNRIAFLPESPDEALTVIEQVLDITGWKDRVEWMRTMVSGPCVATAITGKLIEVQLPEKLIDLIRQTVGRKCDTCNTNPNEPAVCLICNAVVCLDSDCCRSESGEGECTMHAKKCGAGQGLFILPLASVVVAVGNPRNCILDGPYVDAHGETDSYLKRSCQLMLSQNKLDQMRLAYTRGTIPIEIVKQNQLTGRYVPRQL